MSNLSWRCWKSTASVSSTSNKLEASTPGRGRILGKTNRIRTGSNRPRNGFSIGSRYVEITVRCTGYPRPTVSLRGFIPIVRERLKIHFSAGRFNVVLSLESSEATHRPSRIRIEVRIPGGKYRVLAHPGASGTGKLVLGDTHGNGVRCAAREGSAHRPRLADGGVPAFTWRGCTFSQTTPRGTLKWRTMSRCVPWWSTETNSHGDSLRGKRALPKGKDRPPNESSNFRNHATTTGQMVEVENRVAYREKEKEKEAANNRKEKNKKKRGRKEREREGEKREKERKDERKRAERGESVPNGRITAGHWSLREGYEEDTPIVGIDC